MNKKIGCHLHFSIWCSKKKKVDSIPFHKALREMIFSSIPGNSADPFRVRPGSAQQMPDRCPNSLTQQLYM